MEPVVVKVTQKQEAASRGQRQDLSALFQKFGAVEVRADNMYNLLATKETVLLFPGGVTEAYHKKGEDYEVFWPEKTDFIRMAALHEAIVVPLEQLVWQIPSTCCLIAMTFSSHHSYGRAMRSLESIPQARAGGIEQFIAPISIPKVSGPSRQYFMFGPPFDTRNLNMSNKAECKVAYQDIRDKVRSCISVLKDVQKADPFSDFLPRQLYERATNRQAPVDLSSLF